MPWFGFPVVVSGVEKGGHEAASGYQAVALAEVEGGSHWNGGLEGDVVLRGLEKLQGEYSGSRLIQMTEKNS